MSQQQHYFIGGLNLGNGSKKNYVQKCMFPKLISQITNINNFTNSSSRRYTEINTKTGSYL